MTSRTLACVFAAAALCACAESAPSAFTIERTIPLPNVSGRIDHLAFDSATHRLAVAELANGSVDIINVDDGAVLHRFAGLQEPQGLAFDRSGAVLIVAEGGSGAVKLFDVRHFLLAATLPLGADADNVRLDPRNGRAVVGYGAGGLAIIDVETHEVVTRIALPAHPEGFQIDPQSGRLFVNLPDRRTLGVVDLDRGVLLSTWRLPPLLWNYPLALDPNVNQLASVFRFPSRFVLFDRTAGQPVASAPVCGDADDVFFDPIRRRAYVACGAGVVDAFDLDASSPRRRQATSTSVGARTALFDPRLDRLFVAAPARDGRPAAIIVLRPRQ